MSKVEGGGVRLTAPPPPLKCSCNYFFFEASRVNPRKHGGEGGRHFDPPSIFFVFKILFLARLPKALAQLFFGY